ncbi:hypothetical protein AMTRI_Chr02g256890 [Amborella trichopoda]|uniref:Uncharacterized protein n=1 Tax=Amborella trichopoda TaxID=13333 RepID=U5DDP2_AMBTC|nr:hypothetical protein AMTR_s00062p00046820 [Amborella trichopoda]
MNYSPKDKKKKLCFHILQEKNRPLLLPSQNYSSSPLKQRHADNPPKTGRISAEASPKSLKISPEILHALAKFLGPQLIVNHTGMGAWPEYTCISSMEEGEGKPIRFFLRTPEASKRCRSCRIQQMLHILCPNRPLCFFTEELDGGF